MAGMKRFVLDSNTFIEALAFQIALKAQHLQHPFIK
jgi:hypothetical protein